MSDSVTTFSEDSSGEGDPQDSGGAGDMPANQMLAEEMQEVKEEKKLKAEIAGQKKGENDEEDYNMMITGLSEMALQMKKPQTKEGTGFLYDEKFTQHKNEWDPNYPERPERVSLPYKRCCNLGLVDRCKIINSCYGTEDQVLLLHTHQHIELLQSTIDMNMEQRMNLSKTLDTIYFNQSTFPSAMLSLGSTVELMEQILKKNVRNGFGLVRPPGHHAMTEEYCGFCYFNNVAIAAKHALDHLGLKRILIVDWDVHHGQATQQQFYDDPRVLYFSIHRYEYGKFWPHLRASDYDYIGEVEGLGYNINVPLNKTGMTDSDYIAIFQQILMPVAYEFNPDLVLVSAGYDAAIGCPEFDPDMVLVSCGFDAAMGDGMGAMEVSPPGYAHLTHMLSSLAEGRVCVILEGGYNLKSLSEGIALTLRSLLDDPCPLLKPIQEPSDSITESILNVIKCLAPYWKCLQYQPHLPEDESCVYHGVGIDPPREGIVFETPENKPKEYPIIYSFPEHFIALQNHWNSIIDTLIAETLLTVPPHRTCLVYDSVMKAHRAIAMPGHPEKPERISRIYDKHVQWGLLDRCLQLKCRLAEQNELELVHTQKHIEFMKDIENLRDPDRENVQRKFNSIYICKETFNCASMAVGSTLNVINSVCSGQSRNGVAIVRPPGHHAECGKPMGFCFFNTVAIAAKYAQKNYGVKRVLILDWDVHHGNGTQNMFYEDPSVLYISLHRYDGGYFYPSSPDGNYTMVGRKDGKGFNINIPWHYGGKGNAEYLAAFQQIVMPVAYEFAPDLVLVSAGFDAAVGDRLGGCKVTPAGYGHMTHMLSGLAYGRVVLVLEGGYNLVTLSNCMSTCTSVLLGDPVPKWTYIAPQKIAVDTICEVLDTHKQYWKSLKFRVKIPAKMPSRKEKVDNKRTDRTSKKTCTDIKAVDDLTQQLSSVTVSEPKRKMDDATNSGTVGGAEGGKLSSNKDLLKQLTEQGVEAMYAIEPLQWCEHLDLVAPVPEAGLNVEHPCEECQAAGENWVCLICYKVFCSRFVKEHMVKHGKESGHPMVLSFVDLSVWCYKCENYLDSEVLTPAKKAAYKSKFGTEM